MARTVALRNDQLSCRVRKRLERRHAQRPLALGGGVALPHAAVPGLDAPRAAYVRLSSPITTPACDEAGVTDVMALVVPYPAISADYDLLMTLTGWLQRAENRDALRHASTAADVQALFVREGPW